MISAGKFEEIAKLAREAVTISMSFELAHLGINEANPQKAMAQAEALSQLFSFPLKDDNSSVFARYGITVFLYIGL